MFDNINNNRVESYKIMKLIEPQCIWKGTKSKYYKTKEYMIPEDK